MTDNLPAVINPAALERVAGKEDPQQWATRTLTYVIPPDAAGDRYGIHHLTQRWLAKYKSRSQHTADAYAVDLGRWLAWCATQNLNPIEARLMDADAYLEAMRTTVKPPSASTINRRLSSVSSWYKYLINNQATDRNPIPTEDRPKTPKESSTVGLSRREANAFLRAAADDHVQAVRLRTCALLTVLLETGARVSELTGATIDRLGWNQGHRTLTVIGKGDQPRACLLTPEVNQHVDAYLAARAADEGVPVDKLTGYLFVTSVRDEAGNPKPVTRWYVRDLVKRIAKAAGIKSWAQLTPHSLRHTFATLGLNAGAALRDMQDALGHADSRTTRRYDRAKNSLARHPAYKVAAHLAEGDADE
jgi:integrase/recombinase XerD